VDKRKYLIPMDLTVGQFVYVIRKRISIPPEKAIFIFVNDTLPPTAALMSTVYETHRDKDGFMCAAAPQPSPLPRLGATLGRGSHLRLRASGCRERCGA
jgi:hypothetical protein